MDHRDMLTCLTLCKKYLKPVLRDALWLSMLLFYLRVSDPLFEDTCLSVNVQLVIIYAEAKNEVLVIVVAN